MMTAIFILALIAYILSSNTLIGTILIISAYALFAPWVYITLIVIVSIVLIVKTIYDDINK